LPLETDETIQRWCRSYPGSSSRYWHGAPAGKVASAGSSALAAARCHMSPNVFRRSGLPRVLVRSSPWVPERQWARCALGWVPVRAQWVSGREGSLGTMFTRGVLPENRRLCRVWLGRLGRAAPSTGQTVSFRPSRVRVGYCRAIGCPWPRKSPRFWPPKVSVFGHQKSPPLAEAST
jgi:hypothetical protein